METWLKICSVCKVEKPYSEFHKQNTAKDGHYFCCKECRKTYSQRDYQKRKEHIKKKVLKYYSENKNNLKIKRRKYQKDRIKTDPEFRITRNLRNRLYYVLENKMWKKNCSFDKYIGLDNYNDLVLYLESKFQEGMSWDNYGEWEIDHIIPLSSAKSKEELYKLSHYTNLQPLWKKENRIKRDKI